MSAVDLVKKPARVRLPSCPGWCTRDHKSGRIGHHVATIGETDTIVVQLCWWPNDKPGFVQILDLYGDVSLPSPEVDSDQLAAFARLVDRLGHADLAELLRKADLTFVAGVAEAAAKVDLNADGPAVDGAPF